MLLLPAAGTGLLGLMPCKQVLMEYHQEAVESKMKRAREALSDLRQRLQRLQRDGARFSETEEGQP